MQDVKGMCAPSFAVLACGNSLTVRLDTAVATGFTGVNGERDVLAKR
jgi:hypothetical protein